MVHRHSRTDVYCLVVTRKRERERENGSPDSAIFLSRGPGNPAARIKKRYIRERSGKKKKKGKKNAHRRVRGQKWRETYGTLGPLPNFARSLREVFLSLPLSLGSPPPGYTLGNGSNEITYERYRGFSVCRTRALLRARSLHSGSIPQFLRRALQPCDRPTDRASE